MKQDSCEAQHFHLKARGPQRKQPRMVDQRFAFHTDLDPTGPRQEGGWPTCTVCRHWPAFHTCTAAARRTVAKHFGVSASGLISSRCGSAQPGRSAPGPSAPCCGSPPSSVASPAGASWPHNAQPAAQRHRARSTQHDGCGGVSRISTTFMHSPNGCVPPVIQLTSSNSKGVKPSSSNSGFPTRCCQVQRWWQHVATHSPRSCWPVLPLPLDARCNASAKLCSAHRSVKSVAAPQRCLPYATQGLRCSFASLQSTSGLSRCWLLLLGARPATEELLLSSGWPPGQKSWIPMRCRCMLRCRSALHGSEKERVENAECFFASQCRWSTPAACRARWPDHLSALSRKLLLSKRRRSFALQHWQSIIERYPVPARIAHAHQVKEAFGSTMCPSVVPQTTA